MLKALGKTASFSARGSLGLAKSAVGGVYRGGLVTRMAAGGVVGGAVGAIAEDGSAELRFSSAVKGAMLGAAAGGLVSGIRPVARKAWSAMPGPSAGFQAGRNAVEGAFWNTIFRPKASAAAALGSVGDVVMNPGRSAAAAGRAAQRAVPNLMSFGRLAAQHPGPTLLAVGAAGVALSAAPMASDIKASMDAQRYQQTLTRSYETEAAVLETMQGSMIRPSPGTGPSPSLDDDFMNSTMGLVNGLHQNRTS